jgi:Na+:H+ antiporter, NhaA family
MLQLLRSDRNAALLMLLAGISGLVLANSVHDFAESTEGIHHFAELALALFFFVIGLELKNELTHGVFVQRKALLIPFLAALLGAAIPASLYFIVTKSDTFANNGWAIPMATDITFALAVFALFGSRMPKGSKQFLLAFAIIDDLLAVLVIAVALQTDVFIALMVTGSALLGLLVPSKYTEKLQNILVPLINLTILPLYAFTTLSVNFSTPIIVALTSLVGIGVLLRVVGKTIGISLGAYLGSRFVADSLPLNIYIRLSILGGIGFTVAFFVNDLVFAENATFHEQALIGSLAAAVISAILAAIALRPSKIPKEQ